MERNFYFGPDATMVTGSATFSKQINADPSALGLTVAQAAAYRDIDSALQSTYAATQNPATRSPVMVTQKNELIRSMQRRARGLSEIIRANPSVDNAQLTSLGLLPRRKRARRVLSSTPPSVRVLSVVGREVTIRVCEKDSVSGRRKPFAARGANIYSYVGEEPTTDPRAFYFEKFSSRTTTQITFPNEVVSGATVWLSAQWVSARGETSIASPPIKFTLQGGDITATVASSPFRLAA